MTVEQREEPNVSGEEREEGDTPPDQREDESGTESTAAVVGTDAADHLSDVPAGSGCAEIWEHLSEEREDDD